LARLRPIHPENNPKTETLPSIPANTKTNILRRQTALDPVFNSAVQSLQEGWLKDANYRLSTMVADMCELKDILMRRVREQDTGGGLNFPLVFRSINVLLKMTREIAEQQNLALGRPTSIEGHVTRNIKTLSSEELDAQIAEKLRAIGWRSSDIPARYRDSGNGEEAERTTVVETEIEGEDEEQRD
jgi:hypothetical protein